MKRLVQSFLNWSLCADQMYQTGPNLLTEFIRNKDKEYKLEMYTTQWQYMNQIIYKFSSRIFS